MNGYDLLNKISSGLGDGLLAFQQGGLGGMFRGITGNNTGAGGSSSPSPVPVPGPVSAEPPPSSAEAGPEPEEEPITVPGRTRTRADVAKLRHAKLKQYQENAMAARTDELINYVMSLRDRGGF